MMTPRDYSTANQQDAFSGNIMSQNDNDQDNCCVTLPETIPGLYLEAPPSYEQAAAEIRRAAREQASKGVTL